MQDPLTIPEELLTVAETAKVLKRQEGGVRQMIFDNRDDFAARCVVRIGRSVRIRADRLREFIADHTGHPAFEYAWQQDDERKAAAYAKSAETREENARASAAQ